MGGEYLFGGLFVAVGFWGEGFCYGAADEAAVLLF